jgi:predicted P-loop ATPase
MSVEFDTDALRRDNPLSAYLPARGVDLKKNGREWRACCPLHAEKSPSFTVYQGRKGHQLFRCFGCDASGDVIEFVSRFDGVPFADACAILGGQRTPPDTRPERVALSAAVDPYADWRASPPPPDAPPLVAGQRTPPIFNPKSEEKPVTHYRPTLVHPYRFASGKVYAYVLRVDIEGKKLTPCVAWCRNDKTGQEGWCHYTLAAPRRLYGLQDLTARPEAPVVVVEGEKCADALAAALPDHVVVTWSGGGKAAGKTDWSPLAGRDVVIWPDADEEGERTVEGWNGKPGLLDLIPARARVARPAAGAPKGWDCADAIAEGWTGERCAAWLDGMGAIQEPTAELRTVAQERPEPAAEPEPAPRPKPRPVPGTNVVAIAGGNVPGTGFDWRADLKFDKHGQPEKKNNRNWYLFTLHHPKFAGIFALNAFTQQIVVRRRPPWDPGTGTWQERALSDNDVTRCAMELDRYETGDLQVSPEGMGRTISAVAEAERFNPVADYLRCLQWDGVDRLYGGDVQDGWLCHYFGAEPLTYHRTVGMRWLVAGAARALTEGTSVEKVDTMLILEGPQGFYKSTALEVLATLNGQRLYTDSIEALAGKDAALQTNGVLIVEIPELNGMGSRNVDGVKKWMSSKVDRYRPPYGKNVIEAPRRFITAGTVNPSGPGYLHDATGARRFWPVMCGKPCDLQALERDRDQLWAEAVHRFLAGEQWWLTPAEVPDAEYQQSRRYHDDPWAGRLDAILRDAHEVTLQDCFEAIQMPLHRAGSEDKRRVSDHMKTRGWPIVRDERGERWQRPR